MAAALCVWRPAARGQRSKKWVQAQGVRLCGLLWQHHWGSNVHCGAGVATAADPALDAFMPRIAELSPLSTFAKAWRAYQHMVSEAGELECNNPLLNVYRPAQARVCL